MCLDDKKLLCHVCGTGTQRAKSGNGKNTRDQVGPRKWDREIEREGERKVLEIVRRY